MHSQGQKKEKSLGVRNRGAWDILMVRFSWGAYRDTGSRDGAWGFNIHVGTLNCARRVENDTTA